MKKIFAVILSLLFAISTLSIASVSAINGCNCDGKDIIISPTHVQVGQIFDFQVFSTCEGEEYEIGGDYSFYYYEILWEEEINGIRYGQAKALKQGTLVFCPNCPEDMCVTLTIGPNEYPMQQFLKILEKNKNKE